MASTPQRPALIVADRWQDYQLLDCGDGHEAGAAGARYTLGAARPADHLAAARQRREAQARWETGMASTTAAKPAAANGNSGQSPARFVEHLATVIGLTFKIHPTCFKHTGLFPEQAVNWEWFSL
jgi:23S rRNA (cytosine1962-C5)-methyltransferase